MDYLTFRKELRGHTVFSVPEIRKFAPKFDLRRLNEWQKKGYIARVIKGSYIFSDLTLSEGVLFEVANRIYSPSYVSCEMALSFYDVIPESTYAVTSVATRKTCRFHTPIADFAYRTINPRLFFGYELSPYEGKIFKIASLEKAVLDYFYLQEHYKTEADFESLRFNKHEITARLKKRTFRQFLKRFESPALSRRMRLFLRVVCDAGS